MSSLISIHPLQHASQHMQHGGGVEGLVCSSPRPPTLTADAQVLQLRAGRQHRQQRVQRRGVELAESTVLGERCIKGVEREGGGEGGEGAFDAGQTCEAERMKRAGGSEGGEGRGEGRGVDRGDQRGELVDVEALT